MAITQIKMIDIYKGCKSIATLVVVFVVSFGILMIFSLRVELPLQNRTPKPG
jgi:hypothetical protein